MLIFLAVLATIWTVYWFIRLMLDGEAVFESSELCSECGRFVMNGDTASKASDAGSIVRSVVEEKIATQDLKDSAKVAIAESPGHAAVKPLFEVPREMDDLKVIKGIGVVMERTLNDLGIGTFKQLAEFGASDVKRVSDALEASNSGFGGRIERDEWVDQAKIITRKAG